MAVAITLSEALRQNSNLQKYENKKKTKINKRMVY